MAIKFYHNPNTRASIAHWMLEEVGAEYEVHLLDFEAGDQKRADYLAINPMGKVPCIVDDGVVVTEAPAIVAHLADRFPAAGLAPAVGDPRRGAYYRWLFFGIACYEQALLDRATGRPALPRAGMMPYSGFDDVLDTIENAVGETYLLGEEFMACDLYIAAHTDWMLRFGQEDVKARPVLVAYAERCTARDACQRARAAG